MNERHRNALFLALLFVVGTCLFPPWTNAEGSPVRFGGRATLGSHAWLWDIDNVTSYRIDFAFLIFEWFLIAAMFGLILLVTLTQNARPSAALTIDSPDNATGERVTTLKGDGSEAAYNRWTPRTIALTLAISALAFCFLMKFVNIVSH